MRALPQGQAFIQATSAPIWAGVAWSRVSGRDRNRLGGMWGRASRCWRPVPLKTWKIPSRFPYCPGAPAGTGGRVSSPAPVDLPGIAVSRL
jgi:hypothetical protein